jgi:hypothetical protein
MPKSIYIELAVPSNSRPEKLHAWLNSLLAPHRMSVLTLEETSPADWDKLRSSIFSICRAHDVSEQCFAEIAAVTQAHKDGRA